MDKYQENIYVLVHHTLTSTFSPFWKAIAVFTHKPTTEDILALKNFSKSDWFDRDIARILANKEYCAIFTGPRGHEFDQSGTEFNRHFNSGFKHATSEYMLIHPKENGDLDLSNYLISGYCDSPDKIALEGKGVWSEDYPSSESANGIQS